MIEGYINQIIKMDILADSITIIDSKGTIRYLKVFQKDVVPFSPSDVIGQHFRTVFPEISTESSTILKALRGEPTFYKVVEQKDFRGISHRVMECVYPVTIDEKIIGAVCISRNFDNMEGSVKRIEIKATDSKTSALSNLCNIIGISPAIQELKRQIMQIAEVDASVLIYGETGTGKQLVADAIHTLSRRKKSIFFQQNCAAIPGTLLESIFFGTERGVYTGSIDRIGILERAAGGTIFFDEINSMDLSMQPKLLKVLEEKCIRRLGSQKAIPTDFRVIAATNADPLACVSSGSLRRDLFYRLSAVILKIPPLRERTEDIELLSNHFIAQGNQNSSHQITGISSEVRNIFYQYNWPGNVRELKNVIEGAFVFSTAPQIQISDLPAYILEATCGKAAAFPMHLANIPADRIAELPQINTLSLKDAMEQLEAAFLRQRLEECPNHTLLAKQLQISRQTLLNKINRYYLA